MNFSFQGPNNAKAISKFEAAMKCTCSAAEVFKGISNSHKFSVGQKCKLVGLENYPEFNEEVVEITAFRIDGFYGKAYYFKTNNPAIDKQLNWVYEYRLESI